MAQLQFDAQTVAPQTTFTPIPAGTYTVTVTESDVKPTKNGTGQMAVLTLQVVDGQFSGRKLFARINVRNQNPEAERIGQSQLSALCHAAGVLQLQDTAQLHGRVIRVKVKVRKDTTGQYDDQNECTGYEAVGGQGGAPAAAHMAPAAAPANAPAATAAATPPWQRNRAA